MMTKPNAFEPWSGLVPFEDTKLLVKDTGGSGIPILYLNGQFANQSYWKRVIAELWIIFPYLSYYEGQIILNVV